MYSKISTEDDVDILHHVMKQIDLYEQENHSHLGPPLASHGTYNSNTTKRRKIKTSIQSRLPHICSQPTVKRVFVAIKN